MFVTLSVTMGGSHRCITCQTVQFPFIEEIGFISVPYDVDIVHMSQITPAYLPKFLVSRSCLLILGFTAEDFDRKFCEGFRS